MRCSRTDKQHLNLKSPIRRTLFGTTCRSKLLKMIRPGLNGQWSVTRQVFISAEHLMRRFANKHFAQNGVAEITKDHYEFPSLVPMEIRYIRLHFGAGKPEGGRIRRVYAYLCEL